jgi:hypothetical protein
MPNKNSIFIYLDNDLSIYALQTDVKQPDEYALELVYSLARGEKPVLNLSDTFQNTWAGLDSKGIFDGVEEIYYVLGDRSGFTDSRMVYMWIRSWQMMNLETRQVWSMVEERAIRPELMTTSGYVEYCELVKEHGVANDLPYSREVRLG